MIKYHRFSSPYRLFLKQKNRSHIVILQSPSTSNQLTCRRFNHSQHFDIVINGGGIVGLCLLKHLKTSPFLDQKKILLLEQQKRTDFSKLDKLVNEERKLSNRVSSITTATKHLFEEISIWDQISRFAKPISSIHAWSYDFKKGVTFTPKKVSFLDNFFKSPSLMNKGKDDDHLCYVIENNIVSNALSENLPSELIRYESKLSNISGKDSFIELSLNQDEKVTTSLLVGCDGYSSFVRSKSNINYFNHDLKQAAIVGTVNVERQDDLDQNDIAFQRFIPHLDSVLALLPLTNNVSSFVLSVPQKLVTELMEIEDEKFVNVLNEALFYQSEYNNQSSCLFSLAKSFDSLMTKLLPFQNQSPPKDGPSQVLSIEPNSRASYNLHFGTTLPYMIADLNNLPGRKVPIIGDAAHRVHPLAGQGLNLGLGDAQVLSECLNNSVKNGEDLFSGSELSIKQLNEALFKFERRRQFKLIAMMSAIHVMQDLFTYLPTHWLMTFNSLDNVKNEVVRFANTN
jgi:ubiquinone biosynthesis hydroxylase, ubiH/ubiF/visC/COQ6 family